jgi:NAD(P)-dependent dehydrogenase (short-subunit alcohol dehydrogenase family)
MPSRIALVTGSSRGIGRAIARQLASDGLDIAISDISALAEGLEAVRSELTAKYPNQRFLAVNADVTSEVEVSQMFEEVVNTFGGLDVVRTVQRKTRKTLFIIFFFLRLWRMLGYAHLSNRLLTQVTIKINITNICPLTCRSNAASIADLEQVFLVNVKGTMLCKTPVDHVLT